MLHAGREENLLSNDSAEKPAVRVEAAFQRVQPRWSNSADSSNCSRLLRRVDVAIAGGGPAGIAAAITLAEKGRSVLVAERSHYQGVRVGETFPPAIRQVLTGLGLQKAFEAALCLPSYGIRSLWGSFAPYERSFIFDPYGAGWHVDRGAFDARLAQAARDRGIGIETGCQLLDCLPGASRRWKLRFGSDDSWFDVESDFVVDATGRASAVARRLGRRRIFLDRLVGLFGYFRQKSAAGCEAEPFMLIEAAEDGWWYSAPLPQGRLVVAFMTDADLCSQASMSQASDWVSRLRSAPHTQERAAPFLLEDEILAVAAHTSRLDRFSGPGWIAAGDSAFSFDPLSGDGVYRALSSGKRAGEAIAAAWPRDDSELSRYCRELDETFEYYRRRLEHYYHQEARWAAAPFWMRRRKPNEAAPYAVPVVREDAV